MIGFRFLNSVSESLSSPRWTMMIYAAAWTAVLTAMVAFASFVPEWAFVWAVSPSSPSSLGCGKSGTVWLPLDIPSENFCVSSRLFRRSRIDVVVPPVFAAVIVAGSACAVKAFGLWESEDDRRLL